MLTQEVHYNPHMMAQMDALLEDAAGILDKCAAMMGRYNGLTDEQFDGLERLQRISGLLLAKYEQGCWLPDKAREELRMYEGAATDILEDPGLLRIASE